MTKWVDQKSVEMRIIDCDAWQDVLDELEKPNGPFTPRHATSILKGIAEEYNRIEMESSALLGEGSSPSSASDAVMEIVCQEAIETMKLTNSP
ncbi:MAG: hypothetical protein ACR2PB_00740 [Desulfocapsaceae bacterium]